MKKIYLSFMFSFTILMSCNSQQEKIQSDIREYIVENSTKNGSFYFDKFSDLYIVSPKDENKIPKGDENSSEDALNYLNLSCGSEFRLAINGCTPKELKFIIDNDYKLRKLGTGGRKFIMICFFEFEDKYINVEEKAVCAVLDSVYNVSKIYEIKDVKEIRNIIDNKE